MKITSIEELEKFKEDMTRKLEIVVNEIKSRFPNKHYTTIITLWDDDTDMVICQHGDGEHIHRAMYYNDKLTFESELLKSYRMKRGADGKNFYAIETKGILYDILKKFETLTKERDVVLSYDKEDGYFIRVTNKGQHNHQLTLANSDIYINTFFHDLEDAMEHAINYLEKEDEDYKKLIKQI